MTKVFLDTIAFTAFVNRAHPKHLAVTEAFDYLTQNPTYLYTSSFVLTETYDQLLQITPTLARDFIKVLPYTAIIIIRPTLKDEQAAHQLLNRPSAYQLSLKDALHIALFQRLGITTTLSTNPHLAQHQIQLLL